MRLAPKKTALVLIDLQKGIVGRDLSPHSGEAVVERARETSTSSKPSGEPSTRLRSTFSCDGGESRQSFWGESPPTMGVESTARQGWERGYALVLPEDLSSTFSQEMQDFAFRLIFPRIGRITRTGDLAYG